MHGVPVGNQKINPGAMEPIKGVNFLQQYLKPRRPKLSQCACVNKPRTLHTVMVLILVYKK